MDIGKILFRIALLIFWAIVALVVSAIMAYSSTVIVYICGLDEYGQEVMVGVFIVSFVYIVAANFNKSISSKKEIKKQPDRDYFKDGNFRLR